MSLYSLLLSNQGESHLANEKNLTLSMQRVILNKIEDTYLPLKQSNLQTSKPRANWRQENVSKPLSRRTLKISHLLFSWYIQKRRRAHTPLIGQQWRIPHTMMGSFYNHGRENRTMIYVRVRAISGLSQHRKLG